MRDRGIINAEQVEFVIIVGIDNYSVVHTDNYGSVIPDLE